MAMIQLRPVSSAALRATLRSAASIPTSSSFRLNHATLTALRAQDPFQNSQSSRRGISSSPRASEDIKAKVTPLFTDTPSFQYSLGLSYANKESPPFISPPSSAGKGKGQQVKKYGFLGQENDVGRWVGVMMDLPAGRGELSNGSESEGGWDGNVLKDTKKWGAGEDFFGVQNVGSDLHLALSDGVGGWSDRADPSFFSQDLCYQYTQSALNYASSEPRELLHKAYKNVLADDKVKAGGATFVGTRLGEEGEASFVNLGDSGYIIMRNDQVIHMSESQTHFFNCPYQLSKYPQDMANQGIIHDTPDLADVQSFQLEAGDVVILFTDGLSDNLPTTHLPLLSASLTQLLSSPLNSHLTQPERDSEYARLLADILVGYGRMAMARTGLEDGGKGWKTPFELEITEMIKKTGREPDWHWRGGKIDDITVITAVVSEKD